MVPSQMCTSYHNNTGALKYIGKIECCALAAETGSKLTSCQLSKIQKALPVLIRNLFLGNLDGTMYISIAKIFQTKLSRQ